MAESSRKRTLDAFFKPPPKKAKVSEVEGDSTKEQTRGQGEVSCHLHVQTVSISDRDESRLNTRVTRHIHSQYLASSHLLQRCCPLFLPQLASQSTISQILIFSTFSLIFQSTLNARYFSSCGHNCLSTESNIR